MRDHPKGRGFWTLLVLISLNNLGHAQIPEQWVVDAHDYEHTMTITAQVSINSNLVTDPGHVLAVFHGDECRGVVQGTGLGERILYFLLVYANAEPDSLHFKMWDSQINNIVDLNESVIFGAGASFGDVDNPFPLTGTNPVSYIQSQDDAYEVEEDPINTPSFDILGNDVIHESLALIVTFIEEPIHGTLFENVNQTFSYLPDLNFYGADSFYYRVSHDYGSDSAWVRIDVLPVDDPLTDFSLLEPPSATVFDQSSSSLQTFSWEQPIDYDDDPVSYELYFMDGEDLDTSYSANETSIEVNIEALTRESWLDWHVTAFDGWGWTQSLDTFRVQVSPLVSIASWENQPSSFWLEQNYPNPFNPSTRINYSIPSPGDVSLLVFNLQGKVVYSELLEGQPSGYHAFDVQLDNKAITGCVSGIYYYQLTLRNQADGGIHFQDTKKMILLK